jgi:hypothetical protein
MAPESLEERHGARWGGRLRGRGGDFAMGARRTAVEREEKREECNSLNISNH